MTTAPNRKIDAVVVPLDERRPFLTHLEELRRRLLRCFLWIALGMAAAWRVAPQILELLLAPAGRVVFLSPVEPFLVHLKVTFLAGAALCFPLLAWEGWGFLRPALGPGRHLPLFLLILPASVALFFTGAWFGWSWLLPAALKVLLSFGGDLMTPMLTVGHYVGFAGWLIAGCGLIFEVPLVILFLTAAGLVRPVSLVKQWRAALLIILVASALLTPTPDVFTQLLLAAPLAALYVGSVLLSFAVPGFFRREERNASLG